MMNHSDTRCLDQQGAKGTFGKGDFRATAAENTELCQLAAELIL